MKTKLETSLLELTEIFESIKSNCKFTENKINKSALRRARVLSVTLAKKLKEFRILGIELQKEII